MKKEEKVIAEDILSLIDEVYLECYKKDLLSAAHIVTVICERIKEKYKLNN